MEVLPDVADALQDEMHDTPPTDPNEWLPELETTMNESLPEDVRGVHYNAA